MLIALPIRHAIHRSELARRFPSTRSQPLALVKHRFEKLRIAFQDDEVFLRAARDRLAGPSRLARLNRYRLPTPPATKAIASETNGDRTI
jgi:hypothetical protein